MIRVVGGRGRGGRRGRVPVRPLPDTDHVVRGHGHDVLVVVRGGHLVDDDVVAVERDLPRVLEVVVLQLRPVEAGGGLEDVLDGGLGGGVVAAKLGLVVEPEGSLVVAAADEALSWKERKK